MTATSMVKENSFNDVATVLFWLFSHDMGNLILHCRGKLGVFPMDGESVRYSDGPHFSSLSNTLG